MKRVFLVSSFVFLFFLGHGQQGKISGTVFDQGTGQALVGASVTYAPGKGTPTDFDGNYSLLLEYGTYTITFSYAGFETQEKMVILNRSGYHLNVELGIKTLREVEIVADIAINRETPVAFSNIPPQQIEEELASQDLPMILNSTPGIYATSQGGGDGDARVNIRGFNQRNVAVMIDGVPVNDMENGWVYWSNWFGLDVVQRTTQVQRGLGASKIAIPSIGGTINILTSGIEQKENFKIKQEFGTGSFVRTTIGYNSGQMDDGWGITAAGSYKEGQGWADGLFTEGYFYYLKVQKQTGKHLISLAGMGAPQEHGQRSYKESMAVYDPEYASSLGVNTESIPDYGLTYNLHTGYLERYELDGEGNKINVKPRSLYNSAQNYYHKPQFTLKDFWTPSDKLAVSNIIYLSVGNGGGTRLNTTLNPNYYLPDGTVDFQSIYDANTGYSFVPTIFVPNDPTINPQISSTEHAATDIIKASVNNHFWIGLLSTVSHRTTRNLTLSGGIDLRRYKGEHYREVIDLLGADYFINTDNPNSSTSVRRVGDIIDYHDDAFVQWGGGFLQGEYKNGNWSAFVNLAGAVTAYKREDFYLPKQLIIGDTILTPGYHFENGIGTPDSILYNGVIYTPNSPGVSFQKTDWITKPGFTLKTGANYNLSEHSSVFSNLGYLSRAPRFQNVFDFGNETFIEIKNEIINAVELGYRYSSRNFSTNLNTYYTYWKNRPAPSGVTVPDPEDPSKEISANINGMNARHLGGEIDFIYKINSKLDVEGIVSYGDWIWDSKDTVYFNYDNGQPVLNAQTGERERRSFDAKGVHVGDAGQTQLGASVRYEFIQGGYLKLRANYFDRYYSDFNPNDLNGETAGKESWQIPSYGLLDLHTGYSFKLEQSRMSFRLSIINLLNKVYISDAQNNEDRGFYTDQSDGFDAKAAGVFFGQGRRFNLSLTVDI